MKQDRQIWVVVFALFLTSALCLLTSADTPSWWFTRNVVDTNAVPKDYAPATAGQLKWMATKAYDELQANLPGGAGTSIASLVSGFSASNNLYPVNLGQLKYVAELFYARLIGAGYTDAYPWTSTLTDDADFAPATLGQVKSVFGFDLTKDIDGDGMPDWWEVLYFGSITNWGSANDPDSDGLSNLQEFIWNTSPIVSDTDQDGLSDGEEAAVGLDPLFNPLQHRLNGLVFSYDDQDRLGSVTSAVSSISMTYDDAGNISTLSCSRGE